MLGWKIINSNIYKTDFQDTVRNVQYCSLKGHSDRKSSSFADRQLRITQTWSSIVNSDFHGEIQVLWDWELRLCSTFHRERWSSEVTGARNSKSVWVCHVLHKITTLKGKILALGSKNNLAQHDECMLLTSYITPPCPLVALLSAICHTSLLSHTLTCVITRFLLSVPCHPFIPLIAYPSLHYH